MDQYQKMLQSITSKRRAEEALAHAADIAEENGMSVLEVLAQVKDRLKTFEGNPNAKSQEK